MCPSDTNFTRHNATVSPQVAETSASTFSRLRANKVIYKRGRHVYRTLRPKKSLYACIALKICKELCALPWQNWPLLILYKIFFPNDPVVCQLFVLKLSSPSKTGQYKVFRHRYIWEKLNKIQTCVWREGCELFQILSQNFLCLNRFKVCDMVSLSSCNWSSSKSGLRRQKKVNLIISLGWHKKSKWYRKMQKIKFLHVPPSIIQPHSFT